MRRTTSSLAAALASALAVSSTSCDKVKTMATQALSLGDFEGEITMNATRAKGAAPQQIVFGIKKPKYRIDASGGIPTNDPMMAGGASVLLDPPAKKGWALIPAQKKAIVLDFDKMKAARGTTTTSGTGAKPGEPPPKIEKTGQKDTVAGYSCEIWYVTPHNGPRSEICAADGITWIDLGDLGWSSPEVTIAAVASGANRFPLRVVTGDVRLEATKIDKKQMDETRFVVPPDYQVIDIAQMMQNLPILGPKK